MTTSRPCARRTCKQSADIGRPVLAAAIFAGLLVASSAGCIHDWDAYDPRAGGSTGTSTAGTAGQGATSSTTSAGGTGAASTSTTAGTGGTAGTTSASSGGTTSTGGTAGTSTGGTTGTGGTGGTGTGGVTGTGGTITSTGTGGSGGVLGRCGGMSALAADFPGSDPGEVWSSFGQNGAMASEVGGELVISLPMNTVSAYAGYETTRFYDLRKDAVSVEVTNPTNTMSGAEAYFAAGMNGQNYIQIDQAGGSIHFVRQLAGAYTILKTIPYDPVAHRYWQLRDDGTDTHWETSSDGMMWISQTQVANSTLFPLELLVIELGAGVSNAEADPGAAHFDHVNGGGAPKSGWCAASSITDDFGDGMQSRAWARSYQDNPGMLVEDAAGHLVLTFSPNDTAYASYVSAQSYDMTDSSVTVEVPATGTPANARQTRLMLAAPGDNAILMQEEDGDLVAAFTIGGNWQPVGTLLYMAGPHRWWRIRHAVSTLYWDTSPDGKTWTKQMEYSPPPFPIDVIDVQVGGGTYLPVANPGASQFDNLNLPPP